MRLRRLSRAATAVAVVAVIAVIAPRADGAEVSATPTRSARDRPVTITLVTGDRVSMSGKSLSYQRAPGRAAVQFKSWMADGHQYVVPSDAVPLLRQGRLDKRLFDLDQLRDFGYIGDSALPLLLAYPKAGSRRGPVAVRSAAGVTGRGGREIAEAGMLAVQASRTERATLWTSLTKGTTSARTLQPGIDRIYLDGLRDLNLDVSVPQIGAPEAWQQGLDGTGVTVAVLDSGIDATHPDFAGKITAIENFTSASDTDDILGHGTHVASTVAGSGAESGGKHKGVAPGAKLAIGRVCVTRCQESAILAGMEWAAQLAPVVNLSVGGDDGPGIDPLEQAVNDLTAAHGTLFVMSAGNNGAQGSGSVGSPASADAALAVGAVDDRDGLARFSSRGPRVGDDALKPDITAPGVDIVAAAAANGTFGTPVGEGYASLSGASMASPHVAGAAAILTQQHPEWSPAQKKAALMGTAKPLPDVDVFGQGAGRVDLARLVHQKIVPDQGSISFGQQAWPHDDDTPITKTITYRNEGVEPVALSLAMQGDTDTFSVAASTLTVPAGGIAHATVTADTRGGGADGVRAARIVATATDDVQVETPVAVSREVETHDVTFRFIDADGLPDESFRTSSVIRLDGPGSWPMDEGAEHVVRLPKGTYGFFRESETPAGINLLVQPRLVVDGEKTVIADSRQARPVAMTAPRADAKQVAVSAGAFWTLAEGGSAGWVSQTSEPRILAIGQIASEGTQDGFVSMVNGVFARWKNDDEGFRDSPYTYDAAYSRKGDFFTGFTKRITADELSAVHARYGQDADGAVGIKSNMPVAGPAYGSSIETPFTVPFERIEYVGGDGSAGWQSTMRQEAPYDPDGGVTVTLLTDTVHQVKPGKAYRQDWNLAVIAPTPGDVATRFEDTIQAQMPMVSDGSGHGGELLNTDEMMTTLFTGDTVINRSDSDYPEFSVPAERREYRLEKSVTRAAPHRLSTSITGVWTFSSAHGDTTLPLSTVRFTPPVDLRNNARPGRFTIPVVVERVAGSSAASNRALSAEFSVDDGKTWRSATVTGSGDRRTVQVMNPATGFVSLRTTATDTAGYTAAVTVIRAYGIG